MNIPTEFKGKVYIHWWTEYGGMQIVSEHENMGETYIRMGESEELCIKLSDPRASFVDAIDAQIEKERQESAHRIAILQDRKQQLLAIEVDA